MKRLHGRIGPPFDIAAEITASEMLDNPVRNSHDLEIEFGRAVIQESRQASIVLRGRRVQGYIKTIDRSKGDGPDVDRGVFTPSRAAAELLTAMVGTDVGAPTVPYLYLQDRDAVFCPEPFGGATSQSRLPARDLPGAWLKHVNPLILGAIEPFVTWMKKADDGEQNRVQCGDRMAIIDNAMVGHDDPREVTKRSLELGRLRSRFLRSIGFHKGRRMMEERIATYPAERMEEHAAKIRGVLNPAFAQRTLLERKALFTPQP